MSSIPRVRVGYSALALALLAIQNVAAGLLVEVSRGSSQHNRYFPSTVVFLGEIIKLIISLLMLWWGGESWLHFTTTISSIRMRESLKLAVPAIIYTVQNNLIFISLSNIPSATFQVFSQLKVLTTALFSVTMLHRKLYKIQWIALIVLICGVSLAQLSQDSTSTTTTSSSPSLESSGSRESQQKSPFVGVLAVCTLTLLSGFSGVFQERIVKKSITYPIAYFNVQLAAYSIITNAISMWSQHGSGIRSHGLLYGYTSLTWCIILVQSVGGILISFVIRYASNLAKSYVVSVAVFATGIISYLFLDFELTLEFLIGAVLVTCSVILYNEPDSWQCDPYTSKDSGRGTGLV